MYVKYTNRRNTAEAFWRAYSGAVLVFQHLAEQMLGSTNETKIILEG